jgi:hypothetical protein
MSRFVHRAFSREHARPGTLFIEQGPPFDLAQTLANHEVFLTDHEAVFVFDGSAAKEPIETLIGEPGVWKGATGWTECLTGRPRLAQELLSWARGDIS